MIARLNQCIRVGLNYVEKIFLTNPNFELVGLRTLATVHMFLFIASISRSMASSISHSPMGSNGFSKFTGSIVVNMAK